MTHSSDRSGSSAAKATGRPEFSRSPSGGRAPRSGDLGGQHYSRFIPREEVEAFSAWCPDAFGDTGPAGTPATEGQRSAEQQTAHQDGYQAGYRDGLVALESFKQTFAQQVAAQIAQLTNSFDDAFAELEGQIAQNVARVATMLARQVVRSELTARPDLVAQVATDAVNAVLLSARHIRVFVHPDDLLIVKGGAGDALTARGAQLQAEATVARGGCRIESDLGSIDASVESRWDQAAQTLGQAMPLVGDAPTS